MNNAWRRIMTLERRLYNLTYLLGMVSEVQFERSHLVSMWFKGGDIWLDLVPLVEGVIWHHHLILIGERVFIQWKGFYTVKGFFIQWKVFFNRKGFLYSERVFIQWKFFFIQWKGQWKGFYTVKWFLFFIQWNGFYTVKGFLYSERVFIQWKGFYTVKGLLYSI